MSFVGLAPVSQDTLAVDLAHLSHAVNAGLAVNGNGLPGSPCAGGHHQQRLRQMGCGEVPMRMRPTRTVLKELVATLDTVLPEAYRSTPRPNGAGSRSLGKSGRSMHDVLADVVRAVAARRADFDRTQVFRSRGPLIFEVEMPGWIITSMSPGAELFFKDAPWGSMEGQSLADFVQWEDLEDFNTLFVESGSAPISPAASSVSGASKVRHGCQGRQIRMMHFHAAEDSQEGVVTEALRSAKRRHVEVSSSNGQHGSAANVLGPGCARDINPPMQKASAETDKHEPRLSPALEPSPFYSHPAASSSTGSGFSRLSSTSGFSRLASTSGFNRLASASGFSRLASSANRILRTPSCTSSSFQRTFSDHSFSI
jgi:hypothetical protein